MSCQVSMPTALRLSGRLKMSQPMAPSFSIKRGASLMDVLLSLSHSADPARAGVKEQLVVYAGADERKQDVSEKFSCRRADRLDGCAGRGCEQAHGDRVQGADLRL